MLNSKIMREKLSHHLWFMQILEIYYCQKIMESKTQESYTNKYQMHIACSYGYKLECVDDKFSKPFKTSLGKDLLYNVINCMIQEIKFWNEVMKKTF